MQKSDWRDIERRRKGTFGTQLGVLSIGGDVPRVGELIRECIVKAPKVNLSSFQPLECTIVTRSRAIFFSIQDNRVHERRM